MVTLLVLTLAILILAALLRQTLAGSDTRHVQALMARETDISKVADGGVIGGETKSRSRAACAHHQEAGMAAASRRNVLPPVAPDAKTLRGITSWHGRTLERSCPRRICNRCDEQFIYRTNSIVAISCKSVRLRSKVAIEPRR
ncbi:MAG: hypothetical protein RL701_4172 [Pseudomonadota bacterium]|jgi:hypothetical protein